MNTAVTTPVPNGRIEVSESGTMITGSDGIELYRLLAMRSAFKLWAKTGMQVTRGVNIRKLVKETTGLKTNDKDVLLARLTLMIENAETLVVRVQS